MTLKEYLINKGLDYDKLRDLYREQRQFRKSVKAYNEFSNEIYDNETAPSFFNLRTLEKIDNLNMNINNAVENQIQLFKQENDLIEHNVTSSFYFNLNEAQKHINTFFGNVTSFFPAIENFATIDPYEFAKYVGDNFSRGDIQYLNKAVEDFIRIFFEYDQAPVEDIEHLSRLPRLYQVVEDLNTALSMFVSDYEDTL